MIILKSWKNSFGFWFSFNYFSLRLIFYFFDLFLRSYKKRTEYLQCLDLTLFVYYLRYVFLSLFLYSLFLRSR